MKKTLFLTALCLVFSAAACFGFGYAFNAKTGALSYTFFNLSPNSCYFTNNPQGSTANPNAYAQPAKSFGWENKSNNVSSSCPIKNSEISVSFFNYALGSSNSCLGTSTTYLFFNNIDPIQGPTPAPPSAGVGQAGTFNTVLYNSALATSSNNELINPPAMADSWTIQCGNGASGACATTSGTTIGSCSGPMVMANMASSANMFISGQGSPLDYPYNSSIKANFPNSGINPPSVGSYSSVTNPLGAGFVSQTMNLNPTGSTTGGLWLGVYNPNSSNQAQYVINQAMYPLNLAAYVNSNIVSSSLGMDYTAIFGGHFTLAIGDPFIVSSYAAKTLWYLVSSPTVTLSNTTLSATGMSNLINAVVNGGSVNGTTVSPVFASNSTSAYYLQWLMGTGSGAGFGAWGSAGTAANVVSTLNTAASTPITHESFWGPVINAVINTAVDAGIAGIGMLAGPEASIAADVFVAVIDGAATAADGSLMPSLNADITADFTSTLSLPAPTMATAPPYINSTYSASNLLGMLLANGFAQSAIDSTVTFSSSTGTAPAPGTMLYANYSINADSLCTGINVTDNLLSATCGSTNNNGSQAVSTQSYTNVLATASNTYTNTQLSIWDAILAGADITAVSKSKAANNGYMILQNPSIAAFAPPTQVVNATNLWPLGISAVNTTFNNSSGLVSLASYTVSGRVSGTPVPTAMPQLNLFVTTPPLAGNGTSFSLSSPGYPDDSWDYSYNSSSGDFVVGGYYGLQYDMETPYNCANGPQTLNMSTCVPNASVTLNLTPNPTSTYASGASCSLSCSYQFGLDASGSSTAAATAPTVLVVAPLGSVNMGSATINPISSYNRNGMLSVTGYSSSYNNASGAQTSTGSLQNGTQTLDTTTCPTGTGVSFSFYPTGSQNISNPAGIGFLSCQALSLPYSLCTSDPQATGGVLAIITGAPTNTTTGAGATIELACACIPPYLGGPPRNTSQVNFLQTGETPDDKPDGLMLGATSRSPLQQCN